MVLMVFRTHTNLSIMSQQNLVLSRFVQLLKNMSCLNPKKWVGTRFSYIFAFLLVHRACSPNWISLTQWRNKTTMVSKSKFTFFSKESNKFFIIIVKLENQSLIKMSGVFLLLLLLEFGTTINIILWSLEKLLVFLLSFFTRIHASHSKNIFTWIFPGPPVKLKLSCSCCAKS